MPCAGQPEEEKRKWDALKGRVNTGIKKAGELYRIPICCLSQAGDESRKDGQVSLLSSLQISREITYVASEG